jgi:HAD superfamily hydrolase (TIGR01509 family)
VHHLADESRLFPGMDALLMRLESMGIPWGIVTNKPSLYTTPLLKALQLEQRCKVAICPDMVTHTKPHPEPMLKAADALGCRPRQKCVYVGDHLRDIEAGKRASMITIAVSYGYSRITTPRLTGRPTILLTQYSNCLACWDLSKSPVCKEPLCTTIKPLPDC